MGGQEGHFSEQSREQVPEAFSEDRTFPIFTLSDQSEQRFQ
jgi:hypothetical protein